MELLAPVGMLCLIKGSFLFLVMGDAVRSSLIAAYINTNDLLVLITYSGVFSSFSGYCSKFLEDERCLIKLLLSIFVRKYE
jgi:hypothetical protein